MISVIIPYDIDRGFLKEAITSVKVQTYEDWELIVEQGERRLGQNVNRALSKADGEYIKILAEDDILPPDSLKILIKGIKGYDWIYSNARNFGNLPLNYPKYSRGHTITFESMLKGNGIHGGTTLYKKSMLVKVGGYNEELWTAEEYDLHLRLLRDGYKHRHIPGIVYNYRLHEGNKSVTRTSFRRLERHEYIAQIRQRYV